MTEICQSLCEDSQLINDIIDHLLQIWTRCLPYEEKNGSKYASITPLIGTCILNEIFSNNVTESTEKVFEDNFEKIFSALFIRISNSLSNLMPQPKPKEDHSENKNSKNLAKSQIQSDLKKIDPIKIAIDCFKSYVKCTRINLFEFYENENLWNFFNEENKVIEGYTIMAKGLCLNCDDLVPKIVNNLNMYLSAPYDCQKISTTAFYAELMNHKCSIDLIEQLLNSLLTKLIDACLQVRTLCIRGLGNISSLGKDQVQKHSTTILSAMMAGLDDKNDLNDDISLESMNGLTKIIALIDEN
ncbi:Maestro heat-like repeat-containing family member 1, partial [Brachionus plicatilis]